jgi:cephalosporin hydroxylase
MIGRDEFDKQMKDNINGLRSDTTLRHMSQSWIEASAKHRYSYNFTWLGRPVIQYPQDLIAIQEIIWRTRPELVIETGVAHGGSLVFSASLLELLGNDGRVVGIDVEIRPHNRSAIESHPLFPRISLIEGSSTDPKVVADVSLAASGKRTMVVLDSNHTHKHVLDELCAYAPMVSCGCYLIVLDTVIEDLPDSLFAGKPWRQGDNPKTAVHEFLRGTRDFIIDESISDKLLITVAPDGFLLCVRTP